MTSARIVLGVTALAAIAGMTSLGIVACATDEASDTSTPPPTGVVPSVDASSDADASDADAGEIPCLADAGCIPTTDCTTVHLCAAPAPITKTVALNGVWGSGANDVWVVGTRGTILHGDGTSFVAIPSGTNDIFFSVWGTGPNDVWAIDSVSPRHSTGFSGGSATFTPVQGSSWNENQATSGRLWTGISFAQDKVWIAGEPTRRFSETFDERSFWRLGHDETDGGDAGARWLEGTVCQQNQPCSALIRGIWGTSPTSLWAVGMKGQTFVLDDPDAGHWAFRNPGTTVDLEAIWGSSANDVWVVGQNGMVLHQDGSGTWAQVDVPTTKDLHAVWGSGPSDIWAVGEAGTALHYDGKAWSLATIGLLPGEAPTRLLGVWGTGPDDVWVVGDGIVLHRTAQSRRLP